MPLKFGTDGLRGVANIELTPELALSFGRVLARNLPSSTFLVGRDTRLSGPLIQCALTAGILSEGSDVHDLGVFPTAGLAFLSQKYNLPSVMISASHNPFQDNGIKVFSEGGTKLSVSLEKTLEAEIYRTLEGSHTNLHNACRDEDIGTITSRSEYLGQYLSHLMNSIESKDLNDLKVVIDCAHGAASAVAHDIFSNLGAKVKIIGASPNGININKGFGSTYPKSLADEVMEFGADVGLAFDGDSDRVLAIDEKGRLVDGDQLIALFALDLDHRKLLTGSGVAVTVMTNLGFHFAMAEAGIQVYETAVGDRFVLSMIEDKGLTLGGEQSGHIIFRHIASTGDGILTGLQLLDLLKRKSQPLSVLVDNSMKRLPQVIHNLVVTDKTLLQDNIELWQEVGKVEDALGQDGRVVLRASGTESVVRVMVEAQSEQTAQKVTGNICEIVKKYLG